MEESFIMLLALLTICLSDLRSNKTAVISKCSPYFKYLTCLGYNSELTDLHINNLLFQKFRCRFKRNSFMEQSNFLPGES